MTDRASLFARPDIDQRARVRPFDLPIDATRNCWFALSVLTLVYVLNITDRWIVTILLQPMKESLRLSDWQLGLLNGLAFALLSSTLGLKVARIAERGHRVSILSISLLIWSVMTALCGGAASFSQLLLFRMGVGAGEAGGTPPSHSLIADYFPAERRTTAHAIYGMGLPIGGMIGMLVGGFVADHWGWRAAFLVAGLPGILLAFTLRYLLTEPARDTHDAGIAPDEADVPPLSAVLALLWARRTTRHTIAALTLAVLIGNAASCFFAAFLVRQYGLPYSLVALLVTLTNFVPATFGVLASGLVIDRLGRLDKRWYMWMPMIALLLAIPFHLLAYSQSEWLPMVLLLIVPGLCAAAYMAPSHATLQNIAEPRMRATVTALAMICTGLIGMGIGPLLGGLSIDIIAAYQFTAQGLGDFTVSCPGGAALPEASAALARACAQNLGSATQMALLLWAPLMIWPAAHYFLAARSIRDDLRF